MTKIFMLLQLEILSVIRSKDLYTYFLPKILVYAFFYLQAVCFVMFFIYTIPGIDAVTEIVSGLFFRYWLALILLDLLLRILFRPVSHPLVTPFTVMPVPLKTLIRIAHWKSLVNHFNLFWILFIIPLILGTQYCHVPVSLVTATILTIILIDYVSVILKLIAPRFAALLIFMCLFPVLFFHTMYHFPEWVFPFVSPVGWFLVAALLAMFIVVSDFVATWAYRYRYYKPESSVDYLPGNFHFQCPEMIFPYMLLTWRSIVRNTRPQTMLFSTLLIITLSGLLIYKIADNQNLLTYYLLTCLNGSAGFSLGYHLFSIDVKILPLLHTHMINLRHYLSAKLWLLNLATLISATVYSAVIIGNLHDLVGVVSNVFIVIGICNPLILVTGILFSQKLDLSSNSFANAQGSSVYQLISVLIISGIPVFIMALVSQVADRLSSGYLVLVAGILITLQSRNITNGFLRVIYNFVKYDKIQRNL